MNWWQWILAVVVLLLAALAILLPLIGLAIRNVYVGPDLNPRPSRFRRWWWALKAEAAKATGW